MVMIQKGDNSNIPYEVWLCNNEQEILEIPATTPAGSMAFILTENGLNIKMKNEQSEWKNI